MHNAPNRDRYALLRVMLATTSMVSAASIGTLAYAAGTAAAADQPVSTAGTTDGVPASASTLGPITVTARRIEEDVQKVPETVTVLNSQQLDLENVHTTNALQMVTPSLSIFQGNGSFTNTYVIRGINGGFAGTNASLVEYFAEAPCCEASPTNFYDISSVQVLNGPQGTLFGASSAAGAIVVTPQHPVMNSYGGFLDVTGGDYDAYDVKGAINIPLVDDHLALRIAWDRDYREGYTSLFGYDYKTGAGQTTVPDSTTHLDGIDSEALRVSLEFKTGGFDNYAVVSAFNADQPPPSEVISADNPAVASLNRTTPTAGIISGCTLAVANGLTTGTVAACETYRLSQIAAAKAVLTSEAAFVAAGGSSAVRSTLAPYNGAALESLYQTLGFVDVAHYDFGDVGPFHLSVKNIFSYQRNAGDTLTDNDGVGGMITSTSIPEGDGSLAAATQENGSAARAALGNPEQVYTDEFQFQGDYDRNLVNWTIGMFYEYAPFPAQTGGVYSATQSLQGTTTANEGYTGSVYIAGGSGGGLGYYGQAVIDLSRFGVHGLSFTAGGRYSYSSTSAVEQTVIAPYTPATATTEAGSTTGAYLPSYNPTTGAPNILPPTPAKSEGYNYTFSLSEQATKDLLFYATTARAYIPGGANSSLYGTYIAEGADLPNFTQTYQPETVLDYELGVKYDFHLMGMLGRIDLDGYREDFSNIQTVFTGQISLPVAPFVATPSYTENAAKATLEGLELTAVLMPTPSWQISLTGSLEDNKYDKFDASDPLSIVTYANAAANGVQCAPGSVANTKTSTGLCLLNLANNPFPFAPNAKGDLTVRYLVPTPEKLGEIWLTAVAYGQSREYFYPEATRLHQALLTAGLPANPDEYSQPPFATLNLRADWSHIAGSRWDAGLYVNNVTNTTYALSGLMQIFTTGLMVKNYAPPLMFGAELSTKF